MKIMHIASFQGNCGDILSHSGFYNLLKKILPNENIDVTQIEMRDFYRNSQLRKFDNTFLNEVNTYDLLVIGGGASSMYSMIPKVAQPWIWDLTL